MLKYNKEGIMTKIDHIHSGHRQRLKDKVRNKGLSSLSDHEIMELLLTYTIPYKDTNPLGHTLMNTFGSIDQIVDADYHDIMKIKGIGEETALFFRVLSEFMRIYKIKKATKRPNVKSTQDAVEFFRSRYDIQKTEFFCVACMSRTGEVVKVFELEGIDDKSVSINKKRFIDQINTGDVATIIMFHTHPKGEVVPSKEDIMATREIYEICHVLGIILFDHIILNESEYCSMKTQGFFTTFESNLSKYGFSVPKK